MSGCDDLNNARKKLEAALGDNIKVYFQLMKQWFQLKSTKEEFDTESRKLMNPEQIHLHNEFLLCLFTKCQSLASFPTSSATTQSPSKSSSSASKDKVNRHTKVKRKNRSDKGNFEPADVSDYIVPPDDVPVQGTEEPLRYSAQELFLPDMSLIFGRMLLCAWELGLEGAEEPAAEVMVVAVQQFLKNVLTVIFSRRKGYRLRENCFLHSLGTSVPNPWLRNTTSIMEDLSGSCLSKSSDDEDKSQPPSQKLTLDEIEQKAAYEIACGNVSSTVTQYPLMPHQVLEALQVYRSVIPSHTVYSINMERIISTLNHSVATEDMLI